MVYFLRKTTLKKNNHFCVETHTIAFFNSVVAVVVSSHVPWRLTLPSVASGHRTCQPPRWPSWRKFETEVATNVAGLTSCRL